MPPEPDPKARELIDELGLEPHPEGGWFTETWRHEQSGGGRGAGTAILFLLAEGDRSHWHRVDAAEIWHFHAGAPLALSWVEGAAVTTQRLGVDLASGQRPQLTIPAGAWQAAESTGAWTLVSCTVSPAFEFEHFELAPPDWWPGDDEPPQPDPLALDGERVALRSIRHDDLGRLAEIRAEPEVSEWWPLDGRTALDAVLEGVEDREATCRAVTLDGEVIGFVQTFEEPDEDYRHAGIDLYLTAGCHGRGLGADTLRTVCRHLFESRGHHRITIDPAADNAAAVACYRSIGFTEVGRLRQYERTPDGWRDGLFMELLASDWD